MKFILFNLVVGAGLVYLFTASPQEINQVSDKAQSALDQVADQVIEAKARVEDKLSSGVSAEPMREPIAPPKPIAAPDRSEPPRSLAEDIPPPPPPLPEAQEIAELDVHRPNDAQALLDAEAEFAMTEPEPVLMSPGERRRELSILAEDMEALYLDLSLD